MQEEEIKCSGSRGSNQKIKINIQINNTHFLRSPIASYYFIPFFVNVVFLPPSDWLLAFDFVPIHIWRIFIPPSLNLPMDLEFQLLMVDIIWNEAVPVEAFLMHPIYFQIFAQLLLQSSPLNYLCWNVHTRVQKDYDDLFGFWPLA